MTMIPAPAARAFVVVAFTALSVAGLGSTVAGAQTVDTRHLVYMRSAVTGRALPGGEEDGEDFRESERGMMSTMSLGER